MKKIFLLIIPILSCYLIYLFTENHDKYVLTLSYPTSSVTYLNDAMQYKALDNPFNNSDYRITDIINILKYNEEIKVKDTEVSLHRLLKESDILIISVGTNDIYYKLDTSITNIYTYINNMISELDILYEEINKYSYDLVIVLGFYNTKNKYNDLFTYLNYKTKVLSNKYGFTYLELNNIIRNHPEYLVKEGDYHLNKDGYLKINEIIVENLKNT